MSCKPVGLQLLKSPPPPSSPSFLPSIEFSAPQARRYVKNMRGALTFLRIVQGRLDLGLSHRTGSRALVGQVVDRGKGPQLIPRSCRLIGQNQSWLPMREVHVGSLCALLVARGSVGPSLSGSPGSVGISAAIIPATLPIHPSFLLLTMPRFNKHTPGPRASNPYPLRSRVNHPIPSSPLERGRVLGSPIHLDSRESSRPPILNALPIAPPSSVRGHPAGSPIEIDSQVSARPRLANPSTIARPVSPKATQAFRAQRVPPALSHSAPGPESAASALGYSQVASSGFEQPRFLGLSGGSSSFQGGQLIVESLILLSSNCAIIDEPWTLLPAPRPRNLSTPSDICSAVDVDRSTSTSVSQDESEASDENHSESSSNQYTASSNQSYPFARQPRVASPDPPGFYDADEFHLLRDHQIDSLLSRRADPARFDQYAFCPCEFTAFYQLAASSFVAYCNAERPSCPRDQAHRVSHFKFLNRSYMSLRRHFRHLD
ncbi:uncharacterized protein PGTG_12557 [Puccinia graminis f. sp. tritici CRL 75-36-700-3]|uniref:Uncharacterized protein n=1 Tax=Puccinia graminis f. sp. tritici (strain CRL 75-36-700-3 / race SCCL) TaxID=418459 RepID=E3KV10_PUCGT|nr:uncharacterized protein PGTG_12557 [Puccinia graminis f. sp. tritici CRL 75-36-700-3]EFP88110.2 hypothetical protein PGTG_12557 [Puccinia graminis f. sp. tritici CRL 75-36-700-3]